jgi:hypothetical protein
MWSLHVIRDPFQSQYMRSRQTETCYSTPSLKSLTVSPITGLLAGTRGINITAIYRPVASRNAVNVIISRIDIKLQSTASLAVSVIQTNFSRLF